MKKILVDDVIDQLDHLNAQQKNDLNRVLNEHTKLLDHLFIYLALAKPALPGQFDLLVSSQSKEKS
jgi:hypothetical protein